MNSVVLGLDQNESSSPRLSYDWIKKLGGVPVLIKINSVVLGLDQNEFDR